MRNLLFILFSGLLFAGCKKNEDNTVTVVPITPSNLTATVISTTLVDLSWTDKSTNEDGFKIQRKTGTGNFADITTVGKDVTNYSDNGLTPNTTYTYRLYATNSAGASLGYTDEVTVTTFGAAVLTTTAISNISNTSAKTGGTISSDGGSPITARGIVWSTSTNPTVALTTKTSDGTGTGTFTSNLTGLTANTTYYVRAYATNSAGTSYGNELSFKTLNVDITTGLVAYYPFNGNANDESGNGNNGTVNGATLTTDRFGNANKAYSFDGTNNWISVLSSGALNLIGDFTISSWVNPQQLNNLNFIISKNGGVTGQGTWHFSIEKNGNYFQPHYNADPCFCTVTLAGNNSNIPISSWSFLTVSYKSINKLLSYYINGILISQFTNFEYQNKLTSYNMLIGRESGLNGTISGFFNGKLDEIRLYNRPLTQEEITYLANN